MTKSFPKIVREGKRVVKKTFFVLKSRGVRSTLLETKQYFIAKLRKRRIARQRAKKVQDFLFISCHLDMPYKYRCVFQAEQLKKKGLTGDIKFFTDLQQEWLNHYDVFIFYRVPIEKSVRRFIEAAKKMNKMVIYDIDDLVFEESLVEGKSELEEMNEAEREIYFDGIRRHRETMQLCDYGIASTEGIARYMQKYIPNVLVNRNSVPDDLLRRSENAINNKRTKFQNKILIGYFSGSKTHNDDFLLIEKAIIRIFEKHTNVILFLVGHLELSQQMKKYEKRIIRHGFVKYADLPKLINQIDINLAPLVATEFNHGKSEIKFTEASLLKKPTIASGTEAFMHAISDGETGFIANNENEWFEKLSQLVQDEQLRLKIGNQAFKHVVNTYNTDKLGENLVDFIEKNRKQKIIYISPSTQISGGVMVICQHLKNLQERGYNVTLVTHNNDTQLNWMENFHVPIVKFEMFSSGKLKMLDVAVATMWSTVEAVLQSNARRKFYLVQNKEHLFYDKDDFHGEQAKDTYCKNDIEYITISKWCQQWLKDEFGKDAQYIPNGIDTQTFHKTVPLEPKNGKSRILIEGNPESEYKNVDESFRIIEKLDKKKFEIYLISYGGKPKSWYQCDKYFLKVPYTEMKKYYSTCDIFLKTSKLESFSYPPLEMMACEGVCVVAENGGNAEYIKNEYNALTYKLGDINTAVEQINRLTNDEKLRNSLIENGKKTVESRTWSNAIDILENIFQK